MHTHGNTAQKRSQLLTIFVLLLLISAVLFLGYYFFIRDRLSIEDRADLYLQIDKNLTADEQNTVRQFVIENEIKLESKLTVSATVSSSYDEARKLLNIYVPVTKFGAVRQSVSSDELSELTLHTDSSSIDPAVTETIAQSLDLEPETVGQIDTANVTESDITFIPFSTLDHQLKLLSFDGSYFLDSYTSGALYRQFRMLGEQANLLANLQLPITTLPSDDTVFTTNITGVTALTRVMMRKLNEVKDPLYFSAKIGEFLADADLTHVSNEVSFLESCSYNNTLFCSPPEFIETLKASGVDLVEITGNHNNDFGSQANAETINLYRELDWGVVGGGLNLEDARKPFITNQDNSTVAFLAYNYPDSPNGGAIAGADSAGANPFDFSFDSIATDITETKAQSDFVIVNVQYWECYAYPDGYVEFPECDAPIGEQEEVFKRLIDEGADMVVGSSAHQPQTYELYQGKPIYYGLGNTYFDQSSWPGTERGLVLTNYFVDGNLLQTKITGTVYDEALQTRVMTEDETTYLLTRLRNAR